MQKVLRKKDIVTTMSMILFVCINLFIGGSIKYALFTYGAAILFLINKNLKMVSLQSKKFLIVVSMPYIIYICQGLLSLYKENYSFDIIFLKEIIFYILPIIIGYMYVYTLKNKKLPDILFNIVAIFYLLNNMINYKGIGSFEGTEAFIFGIYVVYFYSKSKNRKTVISIALMLLAQKRIVIIATLVSVFIIWILKKVRKNSTFLIIYGVICMLILSYLELIYSKQLQEIFYSLGINDMGRIRIYNLVIDSKSLIEKICGQGIGSTTRELNEIGISSFANLHNDILKFYIEMGIIFFIVFLITNYIVIYKAKKKNYLFGALILSLMSYMFINFMTDNISIYIYVLIILYIIIFNEFCFVETEIH